MTELFPDTPQPPSVQANLAIARRRFGEAEKALREAKDEASYGRIMRDLLAARNELETAERIARAVAMGLPTRRLEGE